MATVIEILQPDSSISMVGCRESKIAEGCLRFGIVAKIVRAHGAG